MRGRVLDAMTNLVPFEPLVRELRPPRERGANPIFQVVVLMQAPETNPPSWDVRSLHTEAGDTMNAAKFDLTLELEESTTGSIDGQLVYNADLFDAQTARQMVGHWLTLLQGIAEAPDCPVSRLPMLSDEELHRQLVEWNATDADYPRDRCLHELVSDQVSRTPDAIAVSDRRGTLSFAELDDHAGRLASRLRAGGVRPDVLVGVCMERSTDLLVALLAVLKAGGAYVPLEPDQPRERLVAMIANSDPAVILASAETAVALPEVPERTVVIDVSRDDWMSCPPHTASDASPHDLAYVLYTSGSTGTPKGVMVEHQAIVNQLVWRVGSFGLTAADRVLQKTPLGFDVSLWELFCPLLCGAAVVMLDPGAHIDPRRVADTVRAEGITTLHFIPSVLEEFLNTAGRDRYDSLRLVASSGEALTAALAERCLDFFGPRVQLRNLYGPTEAAVDVSSWQCRPHATGPVPIGRPVANTQIYVLDGAMQPVPAGSPGELCVGGDQVARGYLHRADLTAERFVADPFRPGGRVYRTGDTARHRRDGALEYLGRRDSQVKVRGVRIELGEIEAAVIAHPAVQQAVADVRLDADGHSRLIAYVVASDCATAPTVAEMRSFLGSRLPVAMIPSALVGVAEIPLTHSGKTDRRALPDPDWRPGSSFRAPRTEMESALAAIWAETLRVELGGHRRRLLRAGRTLAPGGAAPRQRGA